MRRFVMLLFFACVCQPVNAQEKDKSKEDGDRREEARRLADDVRFVYGAKPLRYNPKLRWSKPAGGFQVAHEVVGGDPFYYGESPPLRLHVRNVSQARQTFYGHYIRYTDQLFAESLQGANIPVDRVRASVRPLFRKYILEPRQQVVLDCGKLGICRRGTREDIGLFQVRNSFPSFRLRFQVELMGINSPSHRQLDDSKARRILTEWTTIKVRRPKVSVLGQLPSKGRRQPVWGKVEAGLQGGLLIAPLRKVYRAGEQITLHYYVRNVSRKTQLFSMFHGADNWLVDIKPLEGKSLSVVGPARRRNSVLTRFRLNPGTEVEVARDDLGIASGKADARPFGHPDVLIAQAYSGLFRASKIIRLVDRATMSKNRVVRPVVRWQGWLRTGSARMLIRATLQNRDE